MAVKAGIGVAEIKTAFGLLKQCGGITLAKEALTAAASLHIGCSGHFPQPHIRPYTLSHCSESEQKGIKQLLSVFWAGRGAFMSSGKD